MGHIDVLRRAYGLKRVDVSLPQVDPNLIYARRPTNKIGVLSIRFTPSAYVASVLSFIDSLTGKSLGSISVPAVRPDGADEYTLDFTVVGGRLLTAGANLQLSTTNGAAGFLHIEGFQTPALTN